MLFSSLSMTLSFKLLYYLLHERGFNLLDYVLKVFAFKAEALLMLRKHEEAETALSGAPNFDIDASTKFFGVMKNAFSLMVRAQVYMAAGRLVQIM